MSTRNTRRRLKAGLEKGSWVDGIASKMGITRVKYRTDEIQDFVDQMKDVLEHNSFEPDEPLIQNCVIGHWLIGPEDKVAFRQTGNTYHIAISRCGVSMCVLRESLERGGPNKCAVCDPVNIKSSGVRFTPKQVEVLKLFWENPVPQAYQPEFRSNINSPVAAAEWEHLGRQVVLDVLKETKVGALFGWKVFVRTCSYNPGMKQTIARTTVLRESTKSFEAKIRHRDGNYTFTVDIATPRTDVAIKELVAMFEGAGRKLYDEPNQPVAVTAIAPVAAAASAPTSQPTDVIDLKKIDDVATKLAKAATIARDMNEIAALKAKAEARLAAAASASAEATDRFNRADEQFRVALDHRSVMKDRYEGAARRAQNAKTDYDTACEKEKEKKANFDEAVMSCDGPNKELEAARKELEDVSRLAAETAKQAGDVDKLTALLKALAAL